MKKMRYNILRAVIIPFGFLLAFSVSGCGNEGSDAVTLRVCNWEEYIDEGGWEEDEYDIGRSTE